MFVTGNKYFVWNKKMKDDLSLPQAGDRTRSPDHEVAPDTFHPCPQVRQEVYNPVYPR
jgi:hypothetical protein